MCLRARQQAPHTQRGAQHTSPHQHGPMTGGRAKRTCRVGDSLGLCYVFYIHHCISGCSQAVNTKCLQRYPAVDLLFCDWGTSNTHPCLGRGVCMPPPAQPANVAAVASAASTSSPEQERRPGEEDLLVDRWGCMGARSGVTGGTFAGMGRLRISLASSVSLWSRRLSRQGLRAMPPGAPGHEDFRGGGYEQIKPKAQARCC
jgi:hypothetical protein